MNAVGRRSVLQSLAALVVGGTAAGLPPWRGGSTTLKFTAADTEATAAALFLYAFGLVGYTGVKVLTLSRKMPEFGAVYVSAIDYDTRTVTMSPERRARVRKSKVVNYGKGKVQVRRA